MYISYVYRYLSFKQNKMGDKFYVYNLKNKILQNVCLSNYLILFYRLKISSTTKNSKK